MLVHIKYAVEFYRGRLLLQHSIPAVPLLMGHSNTNHIHNPSNPDHNFSTIPVLSIPNPNHNLRFCDRSAAFSVVYGHVSNKPSRPQCFTSVTMIS